MPKNESTRRNAREPHVDDTPGNTHEVVQLLLRQKQDIEERIAALEEARSRVAFFGGPKERKTHPRHPLFADQYDDWPLRRIERTLERQQEKLAALALKIARAQTRKRPHDEPHPKLDLTATPLTAITPERSLRKSTNDPVAAERRDLLDRYKEECRIQGVNVTNTMVANAAGWKERTAVQRWIRNDSRSTEGEDRKIRHVLRNKPHLNSH
jgi:hypothetical protein